MVPSTSNLSRTLFPPEYFDEPPSYNASIHAPATLPPYSQYSHFTELATRTSSDAVCMSLDEYVYRSKNITVTVGPKLWGTSIPVYGKNASIEGKFSLSSAKNILSICIKLEGKVTNTLSERGLVSGSTSIDVLNSSLDFTRPISGTWVEDQPFTLPLPSLAMGRQTPLPPSSILYHLGVTCKIGYTLKVTVTRKGLRRRDRLEIPVLYLPRTFSKGTLLASIPNISNGRGRRSVEESFQQGILTVPLRAWTERRSYEDSPSILLSLPSVLSFAVRDAIPLKLSVISSQSVAIAELLLSAAKIYLIKTSRTWINGHSHEKETIAGLAETVENEEGTSGSAAASYLLRINQHPMQGSWRIEGVAEQQYYIRATVFPPSGTATHLPKYKCERLVEITTDKYGSPESEVAALGGSISPALETLGLASVRSRV